VVSIDGTKMSANASMNANRDYLQIARAILREAAEIDAREDELYGDARGDELPERLRTREGRRRALREAKDQLTHEREQADEASDGEDEDRVEIELDPEQFVTRPQGRRAWLREGRRALEAQRERQGRPVPVTAPNDSLKRAGAWNRSSMPTAPPMPPTSTGGRMASPPTGRGGWRREWSNRSSCPKSRPA
jgi:hypothetical protein